MKVVIDTNILLVSISRKSKYHWLFDSLIKGKFEICVSNEILFEYFEIISKYFGDIGAKFTIDTLLHLQNISIVNQYYRWNLIESDFDDNKFVDCAIAANADFILTHDNHFNCLRKMDFPKINTISLDEFQRILND